MRRALPLVCLSLVGATAPVSDDPVKSLAGRYYKQFADGLVTGEKYTGEDIVEIVPVGRDAAYVRIHLDYYNGHQCGIYGVARAEGDALVYRARKTPYEDQPCVLTVRKSGKSLSIDDGNSTCSGYCGARGTLSNVEVPWSSKRPIRYLARLKHSPRYRQALAAWDNGSH